MGFVTKRVSDLSGMEIADEQVRTVVVRNHPTLEEAKVFDCTAEELKALKTVDNLIELEVRSSSGQNYTVYATKAELAKLVPDEKLTGFDAARGRRTGFRPNGNGNNGS